MSALNTEPRLPAPVNDIAIRLADEGVPVTAIARAIKQPSADVREALHEALDHGQIVEMPNDDWPLKTSRMERQPSVIKHHYDEDLVNACIRYYKVTRLQAALLLVLLKRPEARKEVLREVIQDRRRPSNADKRDESDPKMVDVVICHLRKRLKAFSLEIKTIWGVGYFIDADQRRAAMISLQEFLGEEHLGGK